LLSAWLIALDPLVNRDAIIYLRTAEIFLHDGLAASQTKFDRPLLPILIAGVHWLTGLPLLYAGLLITTLSYVLLSVGFVATVHTLGGDRRVQWLAALLILSHPMLNANRSAIVRDPTYWALSILALREVLLYLRHRRYRHVLRWFACIVLATLFRFEGLFYALLVPLSLLSLRYLDRRLYHAGRFLLPVVVSAALFVGAAALFSPDSTTSDRILFPSIARYVERLWEFPGHFAALSENTAQAMLAFTARDDVTTAVLAGFAAVLALNIIRALTWPYLAVMLWGAAQRMFAPLRYDDSAVIIRHGLIALLYLCLFMLINQFVLERYTKQLVVFVMLFLPFALDAMLAPGQKRWPRMLVITLLAVMCLDTLHTGEYRKAYIRDATYWVTENTPEQTSITSNEKYIGYFSERDFDWAAATRQGYKLEELLADENSWRNADYLVVVIKSRQESLWQVFLDTQELEEIRSFATDDRARVAVVKIKN
jgi:hypothetical protein